MAEEAETKGKCVVRELGDSYGEKKLEEWVESQCGKVTKAIECLEQASAALAPTFENIDRILTEGVMTEPYLGQPNFSPLDNLSREYNKAAGTRTGPTGKINVRFKRLADPFRRFGSSVDYSDLQDQRSSVESIVRLLTGGEDHIEGFDFDALKVAIEEANRRDHKVLQDGLNPDTDYDPNTYNPKNGFFNELNRNTIPLEIRVKATLECAETLKDFFDELKKRVDTLIGVSATGRNASFVDQIFDPPDAQERAETATRLIDFSSNVGSRIGIIDFQTRLYQEQCFVLSQLDNLIEYKKNSPSLLPRLPYIAQNVSVTMGGGGNTKMTTTTTYDANAPILIQDEPFGFMNKMVQYPSTKKLFNLTTAQLSSLVPTIRLYRIETDPETGKDIGSTEIKFDTNPAIKSYNAKTFGDSSLRITTGDSSLDLFMRKGKRGYGVGLKDFNFVFHGSDPFAVKKAISAKLNLFATSFGDLITERNGYKFADLALKTGKTPQDLRQNLDIIDQQNLDKLNFRLKAVVGWSIPHQNVGDFSPSEKDAVNDSFVSLNLTPTTHEFNFDEMGGVNFSINYLAYIEDYFNNQTFNIFSDPVVETTREARKLFYQFLDTQECDSDSIDLIKQADTKILQNEKARSFSSILKKLRRRQKLLTYNLSYNEVTRFLQGLPIDKTKLVPKAYDATSTSAIQDAFKTFASGADEQDLSRISKLTKEDNSISFFFISDLLSVIMEGIDDSLRKMANKEADLNFKNLIDNQKIYGPEDEAYKIQVDGPAYREFLNQRAGKERKLSLLKAKAQFEKLRLVLGPIEIRDPFVSKKIQFCSIGDIPLSLNYFTEFLTKKMIGRDEVYYPLTNFVKDLINEVIKNFLNNDGCFDFGIRQKLKLNSTTVTAYNRIENDFHSFEKGYEIAKSEFEYEKGQVRIDDISYFIGNNTMSINKETGKNEPSFGFGNVLDLSIMPVKPVLEISGPSRLALVNPPVEREMNYYIFYAGRAYPTDLMTGNEGHDAANGIFHYVLGKDRGIVKNISLDRTDLKGLKELRFEKEGFDGLTQLREVYNANIDCFLNVQALPGSYIYVDPRGFSPEAGINYTQFGIGGYYMITRAEHSIGVGKADTKIVAKWVADTNGRIESGENDKPKVVERSPSTRKCIMQYRKTKPRVSKEELKKREEAAKRGYGYGAGSRSY